VGVTRNAYALFAVTVLTATNELVVPPLKAGGCMEGATQACEEMRTHHKIAVCA